MAKYIHVDEIEESIWTYLSDLEELAIRIIIYELELERRILQLQFREIDDYSDDENWYSD